MTRATDRQRPSSSSELDEDLHRALSRWAQAHAERYPDIRVVPYSATREEQQIKTAKTSTNVRMETMQHAGLVSLLKRTYNTTMGAGADAVARAVDEQLGSALRALLNDGRNVAVLTSHAERLDDIGVVCGAIALALREARLIRRNATILNKVMSRESYKGIPIASLFEYFASIYWVIPSTDNAARFSISPEITRLVNGSSMRALLSDMRTGIVLTFAPSGSAMRHEVDRGGTTNRLVIPPIMPATAKLIARFDAYVVATVWNGQLALGPVTPVRRRSVTDALDIVAEVVSTMAQLTSQLAGIPVTCAAYD